VKTIPYQSFYWVKPKPRFSVIFYSLHAQFIKIYVQEKELKQKPGKKENAFTFLNNSEPIEQRASLKVSA